MQLTFKGGILEIQGEIRKRIKDPELLEELRALLLPVKIHPDHAASPHFLGGAVGFWGYELARHFDRIYFRSKENEDLPDLWLLFFRELVVFDHKTKKYRLISWLVPKKGVSFEESEAQAEKSLEEMEGLLFSGTSQPSNGHFRFLKFKPEISKKRFEGMVKKTKSYIEAGDIYQANLSQRFSFEFDGSPLKLYDRLRKTNPSPFSAVLHLNDLFIASSSPELLLSKKGKTCVTRPIAGTRPRGRRPGEMRRQSRELFASEKERAEHLMLVDLERNDLGRVSEWKSVQVEDFMRLERYARVIHIVSEIKGRLRAGKDAWDTIQAMFPGGTITGCPKIRSMEIIDELEPVRRGIYTGSLGYVGFNGDAMLNIVIRTLVLRERQGHLQVGAGIVADSEPAREYEETLHKGEALLEALIEASA
jgi:para-aminobenzoate synthetase component 1